MKGLRNPAVRALTGSVLILLLYFSLVAGQLPTLFGGDLGAQALGMALVVHPLVSMVFVIQGWWIGTQVQRMALILRDEGRLPIPDGETLPDGSLTDGAVDAMFEVAHRGVEDRPDDWGAWFHVAYTYAASGERRMARKAIRHAVRLFRREHA